MSLFLAALAVTATCVPADKPKLSKLEVATGFFAALNKADQPAIGSYIKPGALLVMGPGDTLQLAEVLSMLPPTARLEVLEMKLDDAGNVFVRTRNSEGIEATATIKFDGGCITELAQQV